MAVRQLQIIFNTSVCCHDKSQSDADFTGEKEVALALQEKLHKRGQAWVSVAPVGDEHVLRCGPHPLARTSPNCDFCFWFCLLSQRCVYRATNVGNHVV